MGGGDPLAALAFLRTMDGNGGLVRYVAQDVQTIKADLLITRAGDRKRDRMIEVRLDALEQALARQAEQDGELWRAVKELARRLDGRAVVMADDRPALRITRREGR